MARRRVGWCGLVVASGLWLCGCSATPHPAAMDLPRPRGPALPIPYGVPATASATPAPFERVPFIVGPEEHLAVFQRASQDILVLPGAGSRLQNPGELEPYRYYFDNRRDVLLYDLEREELVTLVAGDEVGGFAFAPAMDGRRVLYFLGSRRPDLSGALAYVKHAPETKPERLYAQPLGAVLGKPAALVAVNALAIEHGGVASLNVSDDGQTVVFTTADGGLYLYDPRTRAVEALLAAGLAGLSAEDAKIDPVWGRFVVWADTKRSGLLALDRWTGQVEPLAVARLGVVSARSPDFFNADPYHVVFVATYSDGRTRLLSYDLRTQVVEGLALLDLARGSGSGP